MASQAQIDANRANAQHSTGPVTASGKETSSRNSAGPIAHFLVMTGEDERELAALIKSYLDLIKPIHQIETDYTVDMASARFRRSRLLEFEASLLSNAMDKVRAELGPTATRAQVQATALERLVDGSKTWATLNKYLRTCESTIANCMKFLTIGPNLMTRLERQFQPQPAPKPAAGSPQKNEANSPVPPTPEVVSKFGKNVPLRPNGYPVNLALAL